MAALRGRGAVEQVLIHTGQHYDPSMSAVFFQELGLPEPDANLEVGSGSQTNQIVQIVMRLEQIMLRVHPDLALVYGDVNSTLAAALVCAKSGIKLGHVEAGLRSFDRTMPEEINRLVTDHLADVLFTPSADGDENLLREGITRERIYLVGNVMIDTLVRLLPQAVPRLPALRERFSLQQRYGLVTLHRPSNVDDPSSLTAIIAALTDISRDVPLLFAAHPRTQKRIADAGLRISTRNLLLTQPLGYLDFLGLQSAAALVITDSGGIQEESTFLGVPCLTLRENTERPLSVSMGTNVLTGRDLQRLQMEAAHALCGGKSRRQIPPLWDGKAGERIAEIVAAGS